MAMVGRKKEASSSFGILDRVTNLLAKLPQVAVRRNQAAEALRDVVSRHRGELMAGSAVGHTKAVVRGSMNEIRGARDEFARYLSGGFERDRLNAARDAFVAYADRTFAPKEGGMMTWFKDESAAANGSPEAIARQEARLRDEAAGHYDALLKAAPHRKV